MKSAWSRHESARNTGKRPCWPLRTVKRSAKSAQTLNSARHHGIAAFINTVLAGVQLRQVEVLQGQGKSVSEAVRQIGVTVQTYYRWRKEYGGMSRDQLKRLKALEAENSRLRRAVSDLTLDKMILSEAARGNF